jgi:hypothetical protein
MKGMVACGMPLSSAVIGDESKPPAVWDFYGFQRRELIQVLHEVARRQDG